MAAIKLHLLRPRSIHSMPPRPKPSAPGHPPAHTVPMPAHAIWPIAVLILAVLITYGRIVGHDFVSWDDGGHITENPHLDPISFQSLVRFWSEPYFAHYVPVSYTLFTAEAWLARCPPDEFGSPVFNPAVFHAGSVLLHMACTLLAYCLLMAILHRPTPACLGAAFFALHPLQVESVAWVSEQRGLLSGVFTFLSLLAWLRFGRGIKPRTAAGEVAEFQAPAIAAATGGWGWYALAFAACALAVLAKPSGVSTPLFAAVLDLFLLRRRLLVSLVALLPWLAMAAGMFAITKQQQPDAMLEFQSALWARPLIAGDALQFYLARIVWPWELMMQYPRSPQIVLADAWVYVAWIVPAFVLGLCYGFRRQGPWMLCAGWFLAALAPVLGLAPFAYQHYSTVADRYAYLALFAPALAIAWIVRHGQRGALSVAAAAIVLLALLSFQQAGTWQNNESLYSHTLRLNPRSDSAHAGWGAELLRGGNMPRRWSTSKRVFASIRIRARRRRFSIGAWPCWAWVGSTKRSKPTSRRSSASPSPTRRT